MKIATWNVNSLRARLDPVLAWIERVQPDVLCMQETKVLDSEFPTEEFQRLGYGVVMAGEKSYNGVAIAARGLLRDVKVGLLGASRSDDKRLISAVYKRTHLFCCYVPNGKSVESPDFEYKLRWLQDLRTTVDAWTSPDKNVVVCGDFNVAREARDLYDVNAFLGQTHFHPREHAALDALLDFGLSDAFRLHNQAAEQYSWWDYRAGSFQKNTGLRIDYVFVSEPLKQRCTATWMDVTERDRDKPSDHIPVISEFAT
jgi:exodeoxyribonuclease III